MFRIDQIVNASKFIRHFRSIARHLAESCEPLLIIQKNGRFLVVMDGDFFEGLLSSRSKLAAHRYSGCTVGPQNNDFKS